MIRRFLSGLAGAAIATTSLAHVTLETKQAPAGANFKAVLRVSHGCEGSPTTALRVKIPEGIIAVKPMPKPGWTLEMVKGKYAKTYQGSEKQKISEGVVELAWSGGKLPDDNYDEFVFRAFVTADLPAGQAVYLPIVQQCEKACTAGSKSPRRANRPMTIRSPRRN